MKELIHYLDKLEDRIRSRLSRYPILYSIIGGTGIVLFWRGVWITADEIAQVIPESYSWIDGPLSVAVSLILLLVTGLFVSFFVNDQIILSGVNQDKKITEKTEIEVRKEAVIVQNIKDEVQNIENEVKEIHHALINTNSTHKHSQ
ncbi:MAG: hypothetical protein K0S38_115 [Candidatus Paceibacter sp.]|jgi:hypothetical protein|nr:hypothetical protein [Candidatus Paceibacter sp.]